MRLRGCDDARENAIMTASTPEVDANRIASIAFVGGEPVYDIEVEGTHNFMAGHYIDKKTGAALNAQQEEAYAGWRAFVFSDASDVFRSGGRSPSGQALSQEKQYRRTTSTLTASFKGGLDQNAERQKDEAQQPQDHLNMVREFFKERAGQANREDGFAQVSGNFGDGILFGVIDDHGQIPFGLTFTFVDEYTNTDLYNRQIIFVSAIGQRGKVALLKDFITAFEFDPRQLERGGGIGITGDAPADVAPAYCP